MIRIILAGVVVAIGVNVALAIRDAKMWEHLEQRNDKFAELTLICANLISVHLMPHSGHFLFILKT